MKSFHKVLNTMFYPRENRIERRQMDIDVVTEIAPKVGVSFLVEEKGDKVRLVTRVHDPEGVNDYNYFRRTFVYLGHYSAMTLLPIAITYENGRPARVLVDIVDMYGRQSARG